MLSWWEISEGRHEQGWVDSPVCFVAAPRQTAAGMGHAITACVEVQEAYWTVVRMTSPREDSPWRNDFNKNGDDQTGRNLARELFHGEHPESSIVSLDKCSGRTAFFSSRLAFIFGWTSRVIVKSKTVVSEVWINMMLLYDTEAWATYPKHCTPTISRRKVTNDGIPQCSVLPTIDNLT